MNELDPRMSSRRNADLKDTGTAESDENYDLLSVLYHCLKAADACSQYVADAEDAGDEELVEFFESARQAQIDWRVRRANCSPRASWTSAAAATKTVRRLCALAIRTLFSDLFAIAVAAGVSRTLFARRARSLLYSGSCLIPSLYPRISLRFRERSRPSARARAA